MTIPVVAEDGVVEDNLLQQLDELVGEIGGHEGLHSDGDVFGILGLGERSLHNLVDQLTPAVE